MAYVKANFKTGYGAREVVRDVTLAADTAVGHLVNITAAGVLTEYASESAAVTGINAGTAYIVAQSDMTMSNKPETWHGFNYSDVVKSSSTAKKCAFFPINDLADINIVPVA